MRVLDNEPTLEYTVTIVQFLSMCSIGTLVHVYPKNSDHVYIHEVSTAKGVLKFCQSLFGSEKHLLRVYEIATFDGEGMRGVIAYCV